MIHILSKRADTHPNNCEDAYLCLETEDIILSAVFDGCSSGHRSHFASELHAKLVKEAFAEVVKSIVPVSDMPEAIMVRLVGGLGHIMDVLQIGFMEVLSTVVLCVHDKKEDTAYLLVAGDGFWYHDKVMEKQESPNNTPDYPAYHVEQKTSEVESWVDNLPWEIIHAPKSYAIGTDGLFAITAEVSNDATQHFLLEDTEFLSSKAMLARKFNILKKNKAFLNDDLTLIRYTNDTLQQQEAKTADTGHLQGDQ